MAGSTSKLDGGPTTLELVLSGLSLVRRRADWLVLALNAPVASQKTHLAVKEPDWSVMKG